jgi:DNA replicative helicase MCM subunit Mcm2 (Cdc46/Mcm family)
MSAISAQNYVRFARTKNPELDEKAKQRIIKYYLRLRQQDALNTSGSAFRVTVRVYS